MRKRARIEKTHIAAFPARPGVRGALLKGTALTASLLAIALAASTTRAYANPEGGTVVVGDATITPIDGGSIINIDQGSDRIVIDWTSFSIDEGETVNFDQLNGNSIALNRVTGFETSYINGVLTADGYVFLINQNGIVFGRTAFVDVGGLVASTADITNDNFMAGNFDFNIASPNEYASIVNEGTISIASTGLGALVAPSVRNSGIISANMGSVGLAGARTFTLDFYGDGLFSFDTGAEVIVAPGDGGALVENTGVITADGGHIAITALAAENIVNNVINLDGVVEANSVGVENGTIVLSGGDHGTVNVSGTISATGDDAGEAGGTIHVLGDNVVIDTGAVVDASGHSGGGDIRIGGGLRGGEGLQVASTTTVRTGAEIRADATHSGDGGTVVLWANDQTRYEGAISARGGAVSGDGGFVEVSADDEVLFLAGVDVGADNGNAGALLIDPNNFTVTASVSAALTATLDTGADISIEADNDVFIENDVDGSASAVSGGGIDVSSGRSTSISAGVTLATNDGDITVTVNDDARNGNNRAGGTATFTNNGIIDSNGGNVTIQNGGLSATADVDFALGSIASDGGVIAVNNTVDDITINTGTLDGGGGNISVTASGDIFVGDGAGTAVDASAGGNVLLSATGNIIDSGGGAVINMSGGGALTMNAGGSVGSGNAIDTSGAFTLDGSAGGSFYVSNSGGDLTLGDIDSGGFIDIYNLGNGVLSQGTLDATTSYVYIAASSLTITGAIDAASINLDTNAIDIQATLTAGEITIDPTSGGVSAGFNSANALDLTNTELGFLDATGTVSIGTDVNPTSFHVGTATVISSATFDLTIETSGDVTFDDTDVALSLSTAQALVINADNIVGGGTQTDIAFSGAGSAEFDFDTVNTTTALLQGDVSINGTAGGAVDLVVDGDLTIEHLEGADISLSNTGDIVVQSGAVTGDSITMTTTGSLTLGDGGSATAVIADGDVTIDAGGALIFSSASVGISAATGTTVDIAASSIAGGGTVTDIVFGAGANLIATATGGNLNLRTEGVDTIDLGADGGVTFANAGSTVTIDAINATNDAIAVHNTGSINIDTGTVNGGGAGISITATDDITVGNGAGVAIDANDGDDVLLDAGGNIVDGGGIIDMNTGALTLNAGGSVGSSADRIETSGTFAVQGTASGGFFGVDNVGSGTLTVLNVSATGGVRIDSGDGLDITGGVTGGGQVRLGAGGVETLTISGEVTSSDADVRLSGGDIEIEATVSASTTIFISNASFGDISLNGTAAFDLDNTEIGFLDAGERVFVGGGVTDELFIGNGTDFSGGTYDVELDANTIVFDDAGTALTIGVAQALKIGADDVTGGGVNPDIAFSGVGTGQFDFDATNTVSFNLLGDVSVDGTAGGAVDLIVDGDLNIEHLEGAGINTSATGDIDIETGTLVAAGDVVLTSNMTITVGSSAGVAIDASGGVYDITLDAGINILDGGGIIDMSGGGTLTLDAGNTVGGSGAAIETSGLAHLFGSADDGHFYVDNTGGTTLTLGDISSGNLGGDIVITTDGDMEIAGALDSDDDIELTSEGGAFRVLGGGAATASQTLTVVADTIALAGTLSGTDIFLEPFTAAATIGIGDGAVGTFSLDNAELGFLVATGTVSIGNTFSGDVDIDSADFSGGAYDLTLIGGTVTFDDTDTALTLAQSATVVITSSGNILGGGVSDDIVFGASEGAVSFAADGDVTLDTVADEVAGSATGSIDFENTGDLNVVTIGGRTGLTAVNGSVSVEVHSDLNVMSAINASTSVTLDAGAGNVSITAAINAGTTATFISDTIHIGDTVTATDINLKTDTAARTIGIGAGAAGDYNLTNAEIAFLSATGVVTIGTTQSGAFDVDSADFSGAGYDLTLQGGAFTFDDADAALTLAQSSTLLIDAAGAITGGGGNVDITFASATGSIGFTAGGAVTLDTEASAIAGSSTGSITIGNRADLEIGSVGGLNGLQSGDDITVEAFFVTADIVVTKAINATNDVTLDANTGNVTVSAEVEAGGTATINAQTVDINATVTATDIFLAPDIGGVTLGIGDGAAGTFNLENSEIGFLSATGVVTIGTTFSGDIDVDSADFSGADYDLTLLGGTLTFDDADTALTLAEGSSLLLEVAGAINGGGQNADIVFASATGQIGFTASGDVFLVTEASRMAGTAGGTITIDNTGDLEIGKVVGNGGLRSGGSITVEVHSDLDVTSAINASNSVDLIANAGNVSITAEVTAGTTATVVSDTIHIGATVSGADIFLETDTDGTTIGLGSGAGTFNLTNAELVFLTASGTVTIGNTLSGDMHLDDVDLSSATFDLALVADDIVFDAGNGIALDGVNLFLDAANTISGVGNNNIDVGFGGNIGFEAGGDVDLFVVAVNEIAGTAQGAIDFFVTDDVVVGSVGSYSGLAAVSGSVTVEASDRHIGVNQAINASTTVSLMAGTGNISVTAEVTAGTSATFVSDSIGIGATVTARDVTLRADTAGTLISLNHATGTYHLTAAELQFLSASGTVTIGNPGAGDVWIGGQGNIDLSGEDYDLIIFGDEVTIDDGNVGITFAEGAGLTLFLSGSLSGGGANVDFAWGGTLTSGVFDFATDESATVLTSQVGTLDGTASGAIAFENSGPGTLNINSLVSSGAGVVVTNSGNVVVETGTLGAASDIAMAVTGDITIGDGAGEAIDATAGGDVTLTATGSILDGGGHIAMGGGTLTFDAGAGVGTDANHIDTVDLSDLNASAGGGGVYIDNTGGTTVTVHSGSATAGGGDAGNFAIDNDDQDIVLDGFVNIDGTATFDAGTGAFSNGGAGSINAGLDVTITADVVGIGATISADNITLQPTTPGQTVGLSNGSGTFNLTNAEMDLLDSTGLVTVGRSNGTGDIFIGGAGTFALDDNDYDFLLRGGDVYFSDLNTAMQIGGDQLLTFETGSLNGGGTELDISYIGGGGTLSGTTDGIVLNTSGLQTLTMVVSGNFELTNVGDLDIDQLRVTGGTIKVDNTGDVEVETGTLVAGGDVVLTVSQTLTVGDASGVAIDASGGVYDIRLDVGLDIVDGAGIIDMSGGGTLTMDAGGSVGSFGSGIQTSGAMFIDGSADDGVFHVMNTGGNTVTLGDITQNKIVFDGEIDIENDDADIRVVGGLLADGAVNFDAGTGEFSVAAGGAATATGGISVIADTIDIAGTLSAGVVALTPSTSTQTIGLSNTTGGFNLTNAEIDFIDADLLRIGFDFYKGDIFIGSAGTLDLSDNAFGLEIRGGDVTFADSNLALLMGEGQSLSLGKVGGDSVATVSGGGILTDVAWDGTATADLEFNADGDVTLLTEGDLILNGVSGQEIAFTNSGTLSIDHLESTGGTIDVTNIGDTTIETGTIVVFDTLTMDVTGDLTIGDGFGVAIDATTGKDVVLTASGAIINGSGTINLGGVAGLDLIAGESVGAFGNEIQLVGANLVAGSAANGEFAVFNSGGTTMNLDGVSADVPGSASGSVFAGNDDADIVVSEALTADGHVILVAGSGTISTTGAGSVTAGERVGFEARDVDIQTIISAGGSISLMPTDPTSSIGLNNATGTFNVSEAEFQFLDTDEVVNVGADSGSGDVLIAGLGTIDLSGESYSLFIEGGDIYFDDDQTAVLMSAHSIFAAQAGTINGGGANFDVTFPDAGGGNPDGAFLFSATGAVDAYISAGYLMGSASGDITITNSGNLEIGSITLGSGTDTFTVSGVVSGASIDLDVESDLLVTAAVSAQGNIDIDVGDGAFTNSGAGTVDSAAGHVEIIADTVNIGASISATLSTVNLIPFSAGRTIGLGSAAGDFNLTDAEFALLDAVGVQVGTSTAGAVTIGDVETIDLTDEAYHLSLFTGGSVDFSDDRVGLSLAENKTAEFRVGSINGGGAVSDIAFESATGTVIFEADAGDVVLRTEASRMGGSATGDITVDNVGNLAISALGADSGLRSGATISVTVHSDLVVSELVTATGNVTLDAGTGDFSNSGAGTVFAGGDLLVNADTVALGAVMTADNITIQPETAGQTIGLNDASGALNLTEAELQLLASTGDVTIGVANGSGAITIGGLGGIDLSGETYDLLLRGGGVSFADNGATATLGLHGGEFLIDGGPITGGGGLDVAFTGADGAIGFTSTGAVTLVTEASLVAGDAAGSIDLDNTGDLEVGKVRNLDGLQSGGSITVEVHSDLNVTQAIHATNDILLDANTGNFSNSGAGTVISDDDVVIEADTVSLGALVQGDNIDLRPNTDAQTVGLSHGSGTFNLTNAELDHLSSAGTLTIGRETGTGDIFVGSLGTVDLSDETFDLTIQGGPLLFGGSDPSMLLAENSTLTLNVQHILSGTGLDVAFVNSNGGILFDVADFAVIYVDASEIAGTIGAGGMNFGNSGDLTIGTVGGFSGLTLNGGTGIIAGGTLTIADTLTLNADAALIAGQDFILDGGDIDATSGPRLFSIESQGGSIRSVDGSLLMAGGASVWLNAATGVDIDTQGVGTTTFTLGGVTDAGDFDVINTVGGNVSVGTVTGIGSGITINNAPGAGGDDILVTNEGHGGAIFINADINTADSMGFSADGSVILNAGHTINSTQGGFIAMRSLFNDVQIDGVINATGTGNVMLSGETGIGGTGKIKLAGNGLGLVAETGGIDVSTEGTSGAIYTVAANVGTSGDIDIENISGGNIRIDAVSVTDGGDTGVVATATNMTTPDGDIYVRNFAGSATGGSIELAGSASIFAGAVTSSGNVTLDSSNSGIVIGAGAGVTGTVSVSFSAAMDIAIGDNAEVVSGGPLSFTAGGSITTGDSSEVRADGLVLFDAVDNIEIGQTATVSAGGTLTLDSSAGSIDILRNSTVTGASGLIFSADQRIDVRNGAYIGSDSKLRFTAGAGITLFDNSTVTSSGSGTITGEGLILIGTGATVNSDDALQMTSNAGGVSLSANATVTGATSVGFSAFTDIDLGDSAFVGSDGPISMTAGGSITTGDSSEVRAGGLVLFDAVNDITIGASATVEAGGTVTLDSSAGNISTGKDSTVTGDTGVIFSADQRIDIGNGATVDSHDRLRFTAGAGITIDTGGTVTSSGSGTITGEGLVLIGTGATVHSDADMEINSNADAVTASTSATITGGTSVAINASTDITLEGTSFVGAPDIKFDAGNDINTQVGSTVEGTNTIFFGAGNDIITNGTTDASADGTAVTLVAGNDITDGGNTYLFTNGTLRADAGGKIDLTLSGSAGATVTAALNAGGNVDLFLRDDGDLTIDDVTSGGGTTTGFTAGTGYVALSLEDGLLTVNEDITAANTASGNVTLSADDMEIFSTVTAGVDIFIEPYTDGRGIALNDATASTLNLTNAEIAFLTTPNTVQFGRVGAGDIYLGGSGSVDFTTNNWNKVRFFTGGTIFMTNGVESEDLENLFDTNVVLTGASVIDTVNAGTGGDVHVTGTIEGTTSGGQSLTVTSGAADIIFDSKVGQVTPLGALNLSGTDITVTDIATVGTQTYTALGEVTFGSDYTTSGFEFLLSGGLTLADDVLVDTTIPAGTGANITIDDVTNNGYTLTLNAGNDGFITLDTWTNTGAFDGMGTLRILDSGTTTFNSTVSGDTLEVVDTTNLVSLLGDVDLNTLLFGVGPYAVNITGSNVFLVDQVQFNNTGGTTLGNSSSDVFIFGGGAEANASNVNVFGDFTFGGTGIVAASLTLGGDVLFDTAGGTMNLGTVAGNGFTFTLDAGNGGDINLGSFTNPNGGGQTGTLNIINADMLTVTGEVDAATLDIDTLQTSGEFQGLVTVDNLIVGPGGYVFSMLGGALVTDFVEFLNTGGVQIGDEDTDLHQFLGGATSTASDTTTVAGTIQSQGGIFTFGDLILYDDTTIDSTLNTPTGRAINFNGTIDSAPTTAHNLVVVAGNASTATFTVNVGDTTPIGSLNVSALEIILHDVTTVGQQIYNALDSIGRLGRIELNSSYVTMGGDVNMNGHVSIADDALVDTTYGGAYTSGNIYFGGTGGSVTFQDPSGTLTLMSGNSTSVRARFAGSLTESNTVSIFARDNITLAGGRLGNDLFLHAGAFNGDMVANPLGNITTTGEMTVGDSTSMTATGDITFLGEFNTYALRILLNGLAVSTKSAAVNVSEIFEIAGLTFGLGASDLWGSIRGSDTESASALGDQLEPVRRDDFLFNDCIVEVGCLNFDPSAIVLPVFDPVIYLYERDGDVQELRYSDLPNTEIWFGYGGAPDIWEERLGRRDDDDDERDNEEGQE